MADPTPPDATMPQHFWARLWHWLWRGFKFFWGTIVIGLVVNIVVVLLFSKGDSYSGTPLGAILDHLPLAASIGMILLLLTILVGILNYRATPRASHMSASSVSPQSHTIVVKSLHQEYSKRLAQSLQGIAMMTLDLHERTDVTHSSAQLVFRRMDTASGHPLPLGTSIVQAYDDAGQSGLLILGEPGAGKTTLLLELAGELLARTEAKVTSPIPVILNLSSWASKQLPLAAWVIDQIYLVYGVPRHYSQAWLASDHWLLLLDGLDEVETSARGACVKAINAYRGDHLAPLVVCSRSHEYLRQEERLRLPAAIEVQPLTPEQVESYLKQVGRPLAAVRTVLRTNPVLKQLLTTPLMFSVVIIAYRDKAVKDIPKLGSAEEQQQQIFDHYVERMLARPTTHEYFTPQQTQSWLIWLAQQMKHHQFTEFYLERLQPSWLATQRTQKIHTWLFRLVVGLAFGLTTGLVFGLVVGLTFAWFYGLRSGLLGGLLSGLFFGSVGGLLGVLVGGLNENFWKKLLSALVVGTVFALLSGLAIGLVCAFLVMLYEKDQEIRVADRLTLSWKHFWKKLPYGLALGLLIGLVTGLLSGPEVGLVTSLLGGLLLGLIIGLQGGLGSTQIAEDKRITPNQGIQNSGQNALRIGLICMLGVGLLGGLTYGLLNGLKTGLSDGLLDGLIAGLIFGQAYGGGSYLQHYVLRYQIWRRGAMPWHYVRFLEEAHERILLQRVGGGYRFIHPLFLDYFASQVTTEAGDAVQQASLVHSQQSQSEE